MEPLDRVLNEIIEFKKMITELQLKCAVQDVEIAELKQIIKKHVLFDINSPLSECSEDDFGIPKETFKFNRPRSKSIRLPDSKHSNCIKLPKIKEVIEEDVEIKTRRPYTIIDGLNADASIIEADYWRSICVQR
jgi:hypothetical protein